MRIQSSIILSDLVTAYQRTLILVLRLEVLCRRTWCYYNLALMRQILHLDIGQQFLFSEFNKKWITEVRKFED